MKKAEVQAALDAAFRAGFFAGFHATGEGWNGEYPFGDHCMPIEGDEGVKEELETALNEWRIK